MRYCAHCVVYAHAIRFAYVEFDSEACVAKALALEGSMLHGRPLKVRTDSTLCVVRLRSGDRWCPSGQTFRASSCPAGVPRRGVDTPCTARAAALTTTPTVTSEPGEGGHCVALCLFGVRLKEVNDAEIGCVFLFSFGGGR